MAHQEDVEPITAVSATGDLAERIRYWYLLYLQHRREGVLPVGREDAPDDGISALLEEYLRVQRARLSFEMDERSERTIIRLVDDATGEVLRQVPPEEVLQVAAAVNRYMGLLVDRRS